MTRAEWGRLGGLSAGVVLLHALGFGLFLYYLPRNPALTGLATLAYTFGLRHAFDADHIAAIDSTTRKLLQDGRRPLGTGFFFSLGHSTIGASVSGTFLLLIGALNLLVLLEVVGVFQRMKRGQYDEEDLEHALANQGFLARFLLKRVGGRIDASWKMYPLGVLFGLGFDTASEVALLVLAGGAAGAGLPWYAILCLPVLFAAGMSLMDTLDGAFMSHAYGWAFSSPVRKVYYNISVTSLSVAVAWMVGAIELLQVLAAKLALHGPIWRLLASVDLGRLGYLVVGLFVATWLLSLTLWKTRRFEQRWSALLERT